MSEQITNPSTNDEADVVLLRHMAGFIVALAASAHAPDWKTMLRNLDGNIDSIDVSAASSATQGLAAAVKADLPKMKQIIQAFYDPDRLKMLRELESAMNSMPL